MSAFSTISALRRRRPEGLPGANAAAGGASQGLAGGDSQGALADRRPVRGMFPLLTLRSGPLRPDQSGHRATFRPHLSPASPLRSVAPPPERPLPPARLHFGDAPPPPHARNLATPQPRNPAATQPRSHATTQPRKKDPPRVGRALLHRDGLAPIRGTRAGYRLQRPNRRRRPRWDPWRASAGSCSGPPSAPQSARRGQPSEPPKLRPNQSAG